LKEQIDKGPVGITPDEIVDRFELEKYAQNTVAIRDKAAPRAGARIMDVRRTFDLSRLGGDADELESFFVVVHLYARLAARLMDVDHVSLDLLFKSRTYEGQDFSEVMGMVLGHLPLVVPAR